MTSESASQRRLTRQEIEAARDKAMARSTEFAERVFGPNESLDTETRHAKNDFPHKIRVLTHLFFLKNKKSDGFSLSEFFDHIATYTSDKITVLGKERQITAENRIEYLAAAEHLLKALDLQKQFIEYNRSKKKIEPAQPSV